MTLPWLAVAAVPRRSTREAVTTTWLTVVEVDAGSARATEAMHVTATMAANPIRFGIALSNSMAFV